MLREMNATWTNLLAWSYNVRTVQQTVSGAFCFDWYGSRGLPYSNRFLVSLQMRNICSVRINTVDIIIVPVARNILAWSRHIAMYHVTNARPIITLRISTEKAVKLATKLAGSAALYRAFYSRVNYHVFIKNFSHVRFVARHGVAL